jgi:hypothetical protein
LPLPPAPLMRAEEICRTASTAEVKLPKWTLLKELLMSMLLIASGSGHGSTATRCGNISQH